MLVTRFPEEKHFPKLYFPVRLEVRKYHQRGGGEALVLKTSVARRELPALSLPEHLIDPPQQRA